MDNNSGNKTFKSYYLDNDHNIVSRDRDYAQYTR